jgi:hypothetical protein
MGQSKGGGYEQKSVITPEIQSFLQQILGPAMGNQQAAAEGYKQFLPGGSGGQAITDQANKNFQQQTIPSILNAFGSGAKGSSSLNQALAAGASNLNTDLASMLSQAQLSASQGIGNLGTSQSQIGTQTPQFAHLQRQPPLWQQLLLAGTSAGGEALGGWASGGFK